MCAGSRQIFYGKTAKFTPIQRKFLNIYLLLDNLRFPRCRQSQWLCLSSVGHRHKFGISRQPHNRSALFFSSLDLAKFRTNNYDTREYVYQNETLSTHLVNVLADPRGQIRQARADRSVFSRGLYLELDRSAQTSPSRCFRRCADMFVSYGINPSMWSLPRETSAFRAQHRKV